MCVWVCVSHKPLASSSILARRCGGGCSLLRYDAATLGNRANLAPEFLRLDRFWKIRQGRCACYVLVDSCPLLVVVLSKRRYLFTHWHLRVPKERDNHMALYRDVKSRFWFPRLDVWFLFSISCFLVMSKELARCINPQPGGPGWFLVKVFFL
jgi:hypothetical protein